MVVWRTLSRSWVWIVSGCCALAMWGLVGFAQSPVSLTLLLPEGVAYDAAGNLFMADAHRNQVFEVSLAGVTTVVAGTGVQGFDGDGGPATLAILNGPAAVAVGVDGTVYIADTGNQRVRAVAGGQIQTIAGNGLKGFSGDGGDARVAKLNLPVALALDAGGGVLIADSGNQRVRRLAAGILTTIAGSGVQGFGGDGAAALVAEMNTPAGVAVAADGRIFVADSGNDRVRVVAVDGTIATFAGSGVRGFGGDGGAAVRASLFLPRGVTVNPAGDVIFADTDNQRLRMVNAAGMISTVAGSGVQGGSADGVVASTAMLDSPRGVAVSTFAAPVFADAHNRIVQEVGLDTRLYAAVGVAASGDSVVLTVPAALTYGQGVVSVAVSGAAPVAQGSVALFDRAKVVSSGPLADATAMLPVDMLAAGQHSLTAAFAGDGLHAAAVSPVVMVGVAQAVVTATATPVTMTYGGVLPALTGKVSGVLSRDADAVGVSFGASVAELSPVGTYPIMAALTGAGSGNYALTGSAGSLKILAARAVVTMTPPQIAYAGLPVTLNANVSAVMRGTPGGSVDFFDNGVSVGTGDINGGVASAVYLNPGAGTHAMTAAYAGDRNFLSAVSGAVPITVGVMPDFAVTVSGSATQSVPAGGVANYVLQITSQPGPFSGAVSMSAGGLPAGTTVNFSPPVVVPGSGSAAVTMSLQTTAVAMRAVRPEVMLGGMLMVGLSMAWRRRTRLLRGALLMVVLGVFAGAGCGDRTFSTAASAAKSFPVTVTATSTNLAGVLVVHSASVVLVVQ